MPATTQGSRGRRPARLRRAWDRLGKVVRFEDMTRSGHFGRKSGGDAMPRAWSIFSATLKAASSSPMPYWRMSW
ncbi:Uncharacterised protein [Acinetobacter baumannii]|nr:Uncharacterised protein [Acinetobacter baumannii]